MTTISRSQILEKLSQWAAGALSPVEMHRWAVQLHDADDIDFDDWEHDHAFSVAREAVAELEMIDMNLIVPGDAPIFIEFLDTPRDQFEKGYIEFVARLQAINVKERRKTLKGTEPYARFCRED